MDGIWIQEGSSKKSILFVVAKFSDELKELIRTNLSSICHGAAVTARGSTPFSYKPTLREFLTRYDKKSAKTKKGMLGELLAQVLLLQHKSDMHPVTPFFNMEERSIKKGFDLVLYELAERQIWITEVKAGESASDTSKTKTRALLHLAKSDLHTRLNSGNATRWHNAINGAHIAIQKNKVKSSILDILERALARAQDDTLSAKSINVVLVSVLFKDLADAVTLQAVRDTRAEIKSEKLFRKVIAVSLQKGTFEKIERFLRSEASK